MAGVGTFQTRHLDHFSEVEQAAKDKAVRVLLLSPNLFEEGDLRPLAAAATRFAGVVAIIISDSDTLDLEKLLQLGASGATRLVNLWTAGPVQCNVHPRRMNGVRFRQIVLTGNPNIAAGNDGRAYWWGIHPVGRDQPRTPEAVTLP